MTKKQRNDRNGRNRKAAGPRRIKNSNKNKNSKIEYVTLPYDFIPFANKWCFPYEEPLSGCNQHVKGEVPKHNCMDGVSGTITYQITPHSDLALEVRETLNGEHFISGSTIRGKIRANLEILSASYPEFIDRSPILFRDLAGPDKESYRQRIEASDGAKENNDKSDGIESSIQVGFLRKVGDDFYVTPAKQIFDKNFLTIKEHRLMKMQLGSTGENFTTIYNWGGRLTEFDKLQNEIDSFTTKIKLERKKVSNKLKEIQEDISLIFTKKFPFNKVLSKIRESKSFDDSLEEEKVKLLRKLKEIPPRDPELHRLYQLYVERWGLKAKLDQKYLELGKPSKNKNKEKQNFRHKKFSPYQRSVFFKSGPNGGIERIQFESSEGVTQKGYLFNSTNASSKRSHYFVMEPDRERQSEYFVPQSVINGYNRAMKRFHIPDRNNDFQQKCKAFYDIFTKYDEACKFGSTSEGLIVFFQSTEKKIKHIGRTPYFKIAYKHGIGDIIGTREPHQVDYANALFGFIPNKQTEEDNFKVAYKSRLRFTPLDIVGNIDSEIVEDLVLMTPSASASAMYLKQDGGKLKTYEAEDPPELNGYKFYHVLKQPIKPEKKHKEDEFVSCRRVLKNNGFYCSGKIYFHNLTEEELGLLLLSLDWRELGKSRKYGDMITGLINETDKAYELIGGAKPYGYGKVMVDILGLKIEKAETDFKSLVLEPTEKIGDWGKYIDAFITSMGGDKYFENIHFKCYIQSKAPVQNNNTIEKQGNINIPKHITWENMYKDMGNSKGGGYPSTWRLKPKADEY